MSFKTKTNYFGLSIDGAVLVSTTEGKAQNTVEAKDESGFVIANQTIGVKKSPSTSYVITKNITLDDIVMGNVNTVDNEKFCLTNVSINTAQATAPTMTASGQQVESTATIDGCTSTLPSISVSGIHHAQNFGVFTISGQGAHLTSSTLNATCAVSTAEKDGDTIAHDINDARITINGSIQVSNASYAVPTLSVANDWAITAPITETNPDSNYPTYSFTITKYLTKD